MEVSKFDQYHEYLSSVSLRLQMVYPNTCIMVSKANGVRVEVSENILETSRAYWQLRPPSYHNQLDHKICYKPVIPRSARWRRNGVDWSSFTKEVESKMSNLPLEPNLSLRVPRFNDILIFAITTHVGKSKPSMRSKTWMTPHIRAKIRIRNHLRQMIHQNCQE